MVGTSSPKLSYWSYWEKVWSLTWASLKDHWRSIGLGYLAIPCLDMIMYYMSGRSMASQAVGSNFLTQMFPLTLAALALTVAYILLIAPFRLHRKDMESLAGERRELGALRSQLEDLNTPRISMDFLGLQDDLGDQKVLTAIIILNGLSVEPQRVEMFCLDATQVKLGHTTLNVRFNEPGLSFTLNRGEPHRVAAIRFDYTEQISDINVLIPSKLSANNIFRGSEFLVTFAAYGKMSPVELQLVCGLGDSGFYVAKADYS